MPHLSKHTIGTFLATGCERQLALALATDATGPSGSSEAEHLGMPGKQTVRPGIQLITKAGRDWEFKKVRDVEETFPPGCLVANAVTHLDQTTGRHVVVRYARQNLDTALPGCSSGQFIVEAQFDVTRSFRAGYNCSAGPLASLTFASLRPDLIRVADHTLVPSGTEVRPDGALTPFGPTDYRLRLRVIDIKLTSEANAGYFAEVAYYTIALAGWLADNGLADRYLVTSDAAVWPGSHQASALREAQAQAATAGQTLALANLLTALDEDLETVPFEVFALWLADFFGNVLPPVVTGLPGWRSLAWHVDNSCRNCDWLGQKWLHRDGSPAWESDQCIPTAETTNHLSRVAFLSKGAAEALRQRKVSDVGALAELQPSDGAFDSHQALRAGRNVVGARALTLQTSTGTGTAAGAGTSAVMPGYVDLSIRVACYFDVGSGITVAFAVDGYLKGNPAQKRQSQLFRPQVYIVDRKDLTEERERLVAFLQRLNQILVDARATRADASYQVYVWDRAQYEHLIRVIGRHLDAILDPANGVQDLAWLFPPEELAPNPALVTRRSPITIVRDVVKSLVGAPIAHYYSLLELAKVYQPTSQTTAFTINPHPMFHDPLSDQIPSERAHEIWTRITPRPAYGDRPAQTRDFQQVQADLRSNVILRLNALRLVVDRLAEDLRGTLKSQAPQIELGPIATQSRFAADSHLWYAHCKLNAELAKVDTYTARAMGVSEREARFQAARLPQRLTTQQAEQYLGGPDPDVRTGRRRVYDLGPLSREMKVKDGDFALCLAPAQDPTFLDQAIFPHESVAGIPTLQPWQRRWRMDDVTACTVVRFDRSGGKVVVDLANPAMVAALEAAGVVDLTNDAVLDHRPVEFLTTKVQQALAFIGNPLLAQLAASTRAARATGQSRRTRRARTTPPTAAAAVLWTSSGLANVRVPRDLDAAQAALTAIGSLNDSQRQAWSQALSSRLSLIWGPPGTGKSHTLRAIITSAAAAAHAQGQPLRVMVTGPTYTAIDTVVGTDLAVALTEVIPDGFRISRLRSTSRHDTPEPGVEDVVLERSTPSQAFGTLLDELITPSRITVVSVSPQQAFNLTRAANIRTSSTDTPGAELFDLIVIDEASQVDVATASLPLIALAADGSLVVCGDDLQMPPIHTATPPKDLEEMVESIYVYLHKVGGVTPVMLATNYRSNQDIVDFVKTAGYNSLSAHSPMLRLHLPTPLPTVQPADWPATLPFSADYASLLDPDRPATAFVYSEGLASQWNEFEAQTAAALVRLLFGRLTMQLIGEHPPASESVVKPTTLTPYPADAFFTRGVGVVTPHRAQQALVIERLREGFSGVPGVTEELIRGAVDTVERYQGQQRDVIIATMALGDPDAIADEDEFLLNLRRFNVMASRARAKLVVLATRQVAAHMPTEPDVMRDSRLIKSYLGLFCAQATPVSLPWLVAGGSTLQPGTHRWHS